MMKNADCTLYHYEDGCYLRYPIKDVYWRENRAGNIMKSGLQNADSTTIYIYSNPCVEIVPTKDLFVFGNCPFEFDNTSQGTISQSMQELRKSYHCVAVSSVDKMIFGGLPHIEVSAK